MMRTTIVGLAVLGATTTVLPGTASAATCSTLVCASANIYPSYVGTCGSPTYTPYPHRHCSYRFAWSATGIAVTPGSLDWEVSPPEAWFYGTEAGGCSWTTSGNCTSSSSIPTRVVAVRCGYAQTITAYISATATSVTFSATDHDSASISFYAPPC